MHTGGGIRRETVRRSECRSRHIGHCLTCHARPRNQTVVRACPQNRCCRIRRQEETRPRARSTCVRDAGRQVRTRAVLEGPVRSRICQGLRGQGDRGQTGGNVVQRRVRSRGCRERARRDVRGNQVCLRGCEQADLVGIEVVVRQGQVVARINSKGSKGRDGTHRRRQGEACRTGVVVLHDLRGTQGTRVQTNQTHISTQEGGRVCSQLVLHDLHTRRAARGVGVRE